PRTHSEPSPWLPSRWLWIAAIWSGVGLFDATQTVLVMRSEGMHHAWARRFSPAQWRRFRTWGTHIGACAAIGLVFAVWSATLEELLNPWAKVSGPGPFVTLWLEKFYNGLLSFTVLSRVGIFP